MVFVRSHSRPDRVFSADQVRFFSLNLSGMDPSGSSGGSVSGDCRLLAPEVSSIGGSLSATPSGDSSVSAEASSDSRDSDASPMFEDEPAEHTGGVLGVVPSRPSPRRRKSLAPVGAAARAEGFSWVLRRVEDAPSNILSAEVLKRVVDVDNLVSGIGDDEVEACACLPDERVFMRTMEDGGVCTYVYAVWFRELHLRLPFDSFEMEVLRELNVAPTQLHPNSWASLQAFRVVCFCLRIPLSAKVFLYHYMTRPTTPVGWVSLIGRPQLSFIAPFKSSYKNFQRDFFKFCPGPAGRHHFFDDRGFPLFPFYWTSTPKRIQGVPVDCLTEEERGYVEVLQQLPKGLLARDLIRIFKSPTCRKDFAAREFCFLYSSLSEVVRC